MPSTERTVSIKPSSAREKCGSMTLHLKNRHNATKRMVTSAYCNRWDCERCRPILETKWIKHADSLLSRVGRDCKLYVASVPVSRWHTVSTRIRRSKGNYFTVETLDGYLMVFTTSSKVDGDGVTANRAIELFASAVKSTPVTRKPVSSSREWAYSLVSAPKTSEWERVEGFSATAEEIASVVQKAGYSPQWFWSDQSYGFVFTTPAAVVNVSIRDMSLALAAGIYPQVKPRCIGRLPGAVVTENDSQ